MKNNHIPEGNYYNKYKSKNPIEVLLMKNFHNTLFQLISVVKPKNLYEIGCGEGYIAKSLIAKNYNITGSDISKTCIEKANKEVGPFFEVKSVYDLKNKDINNSDLIICLEVLEHLEHPMEALSVIKKLNVRNIIFSVPLEPIWRMLNMCRGAYLKDFGNTPGHLNHWSKKSFIKLLESEFRVVKVKTPFPWTMVLVKNS